MVKTLPSFSGARSTCAYYLYDDVTGEQSKVFTVNDDISDQAPGTLCAVEVASIYVSYVAAAVAGTRALAVDILDSNDVLLQRIGASASLTSGQTKTFSFGRGLTAAAITLGSATHCHEQLPSAIRLRSGMKIRVGAVSGSNGGDNMVAVVHFL